MYRGVSPAGCRGSRHGLARLAVLLDSRTAVRACGGLAGTKLITTQTAGRLALRITAHGAHAVLRGIALSSLSFLLDLPFCYSRVTL
jgi:hypothetical protein